MRHQGVPVCGEPIPPARLVLGKPGRAQLPQPVGEHAGRHARDPGRYLPVRESLVAKLPHHPQGPPPPKYLEQLKKGGIVTNSP